MKYELQQDLTLNINKTPITMSAGSAIFVASKVNELNKSKINSQCLHTNSGNLV